MASSLSLSQYRNVDPDDLTELLDTSWLVWKKQDGMKPKGVYDGGCASIRRGDPANSHIGLRLVPGNAHGEARYTGNRAAWNPQMDELAEMVNDHPDSQARIYVPIQWVLAAAEADGLDDLTSRD